MGSRRNRASLAHAALDPLTLEGEGDLRASCGQPLRDRPRDRTLVGDAEHQSPLSLEHQRDSIQLLGTVGPVIRVAVVTGSSSGIGAAVCRALRAHQWHVVGLSRNPAPDADEHEACDVSDRDQVDAVAARVLERHPKIGVLVNNAGIPARGTFLDTDPERIEAVIDTNYLGSVWVVRAFVPGLGKGARVANVVSVAGTVADGPYSASKHAQLAFSRSLGVELASRGVHVLTVNPGFVETGGFPQRTRMPLIVRRLVVDPPFVAERILEALARDRREIFVPRWYRPAAWLQALLPGALAGGSGATPPFMSRRRHAAPVSGRSRPRSRARS